MRYKKRWNKAGGHAHFISEVDADEEGWDLRLLPPEAPVRSTNSGACHNDEPDNHCKYSRSEDIGPSISNRNVDSPVSVEADTTSQPQTDDAAHAVARRGRTSCIEVTVYAEPLSY